MSQKFAQGKLPSGNPLVNALMVVAAALAVGAAIVLGFFTLIVLLGVIVILAGVIGIRIWWFNRKVRKAAARGERSVDGQRASIEGEYRIVSRKSERERRE